MDFDKLSEVDSVELDALHDVDWDIENTQEDLDHAAEWAKIKSNLNLLPEIQQQAVLRWDSLGALQKHYVHFTDFLFDCMTELMGFECSPIQLDIGEYLQFGDAITEAHRQAIIDGDMEPLRYMMIQAQRSQAKSTIVAIFAVWCLIYNPKYRVLIISAGSDVAMEIANWIIQIIMNWDILECMRPDRQHGDRSSAKAFDVHWQLKGAEKSPSIACIGVTANMQGRRADLLIPDDIESSKNGLTETQRQNLIHLSKDFTSICQKGRIVYLGTPQTNDSIYNTLPGRGYTIRIWTGRYPTSEQLPNYGPHLAPFIRRQLEADPSLQTGAGVDGTAGKVTDPMLLPEELLVSKELDQGPSYFALQHMLDTKLSDEGRFPLKTKNLLVMPLNMERAPGEVVWMPDPNKKIEMSGYAVTPELYRPFSMSEDTYEYESKYLYVDTAGGGANGDETCAWVVYFLHGYIYCMEMLPLPGGYDDSIFEALSDLALRHMVNEIGCESNHGYGSFAQMWRPVLQRKYQAAGHPGAPKIDDDWVSTQKELRIIDTLEPLFARHKIIINEDVFQVDKDTVNKYPLDTRHLYTLINQINRITRERGCLVHDDRLDGLAGAVRKYVDRIAIDEKVRMTQKVCNQNVDMMKEWSADFAATVGGAKLGNVIQARKDRRNKRRRR